MQLVPEDEASETQDDYAIRECTPTLYPLNPTADTVHKRNEFVYQFPDDGVKVIIGPFNRANGWVWRVEIYANANNDATQELYPTFDAAFERVKTYMTNHVGGSTGSQADSP